MLKEALEDAIERGEKLRQDITRDILHSQVFSDLANNPLFVNAVARVIRSKAEVARSMQKRVKEIMEAMQIPTRQQVRIYERRVARLEKELDSVSRKFSRQTSKTSAKRSSKSGAKSSRPVRKAARKKSSVARKKISR